MSVLFNLLCWIFGIVLVVFVFFRWLFQEKPLRSTPELYEILHRGESKGKSGRDEKTSELRNRIKNEKEDENIIEETTSNRKRSKVLLFSTGSFSPIHRDHVEMFQVAKSWLEERDFE